MPRRGWRFNSNLFSWKGDIAVAEASTLGLTAEKISRFGWPRQFTVRSRRTGQERMFIQSDTVKDQERELVAVVYICPGSGIQPIHVLND